MATLFDANKLIRKQERENKTPKSWTFKPQQQQEDEGGIYKFDKDSLIDNSIGNLITGALDVGGGVTSFVGADDTSNAILNQSDKIRNQLQNMLNRVLIGNI